MQIQRDETNIYLSYTLIPLHKQYASNHTQHDYFIRWYKMGICDFGFVLIAIFIMFSTFQNQAQLNMMGKIAPISEIYKWLCINYLKDKLN